jgi:CHASE3 domain sensor protein
MPANGRFPWNDAKSCLLPKVKAVLVLPLLVLLVIGFISFRSVGRFTRDAAAVTHTHEVLAHLGDAAGALKDLDGGTRNFVLTGENVCLQPYDAARDTLYQDLQTVARLTADNPRQQQRLAALQPLIENLLAITSATIDERKTGNRESALVRIQTGRGEAAMYRLHIAIQELQDEERSLLEQRRADAQSSGSMTQGIIVLAIVAAVLLAALTTMAIHRDITARHRAEQERETIIEQLREALTTVKTLSGLLPICAWCKNIRDDQGYWKELEEYIKDHTEADFTHGICPECLETQQGEVAAQVGHAGT